MRDARCIFMKIFRVSQPQSALSLVSLRIAIDCAAVDLDGSLGRGNRQSVDLTKKECSCPLGGQQSLCWDCLGSKHFCCPIELRGCLYECAERLWATAEGCKAASGPAFWGDARRICQSWHQHPRVTGASFPQWWEALANAAAFAPAKFSP